MLDISKQKIIDLLTLAFDKGSSSSYEDKEKIILEIFFREILKDERKYRKNISDYIYSNNGTVLFNIILGKGIIESDMGFKTVYFKNKKLLVNQENMNVLGLPTVFVQNQ